MFYLGLILGIVIREYGLGFLSSQNGAFRAHTFTLPTMFTKIMSLCYSLGFGVFLGIVFLFMW